MSKLDQFKLFCTIQLQSIDQREIAIRKELSDLSLQREYLTEFLHDLQSSDIAGLSDFNQGEIEIFRSLLIKTGTE